MKKNILIFTLLTFSVFDLISQVTLDRGTNLIPSSMIPSANVADWASAGMLPLDGPEFSFPIPAAGKDANDELDKLIGTITDKDNPFVIKLDPGTYTFLKPINMIKNMILRGAGACVTTIDGVIRANGIAPTMKILIINSKDPSEVSSFFSPCNTIITSCRYTNNYIYVDNYDPVNNMPKIKIGDYCKVNSQLFEVTNADRYKITFKTTIRGGFI